MLHGAHVRFEARPEQQRVHVAPDIRRERRLQLRLGELQLVVAQRFKLHGLLGQFARARVFVVVAAKRGAVGRGSLFRRREGGRRARHAASRGPRSRRAQG